MYYLTLLYRTMVFLRFIFWIYNMKLCIFPQNARDFHLDSSNITYNLEERAQARLGRRAPCRGLNIYFDSQQTVQCKPPAGDNSILYIVISILYELYVILA